MMTKAEIGKIIQQSRLAAGLTQMQVATRLNRPQQTIANWEVGRSQPDANTLFALFQILDTDINRAFGLPSAKKETPPVFSDEAQKIAARYDKLDDRGKKVVQAVIGCECAVLSTKEVTPAAANPPAALPRAKRTRGMVQLKVYDQPAAAGLGNYLDEPAHHIEQYPADMLPPSTDFGILISGDSMEPEIRDGSTAFVEYRPSIDSGKIGIFVVNGQAYCKRLFVDHERRQVRLVSANQAYGDLVIGEFDKFDTVGLVLGHWTKGENQDIFSW